MCEFSHKKEVTVERFADEAAPPSESTNPEVRNGRLGSGKFGWTPTDEKSVVSLRPSGSSRTENEQPKKIQENEMEVDTELFEEKRKENENDCKGSDGR